nr:ATP synthase alpha chain - mouse [Mus musculus]
GKHRLPLTQSSTRNVSTMGPTRRRSCTAFTFAIGQKRSTVAQLVKRLTDA